MASVTARAGLSDACAISYIQYIGVVSAGLPSATSGGGAAKFTNRHLFLKSHFASQHTAECVIKRQCTDRYIYVPKALKVREFLGISDLFAALDQRAVAPGAAQKGKKSGK